MRRALGAGAVHAYAAVGATYAMLGLGAQSCGVMVSSDCVQRLICSHDDGSSELLDSSDVFAGTESADSDAPPTLESGDIGTEEHVASEPDVRDADAGPRDAVSEDVAIETTPPSDGSCNPPYTCGLPAQAGWTGPALVWTGPSGSTAPTCPDGYQSTDVNQGLTGTDPGSCGCTCSLANETCTMTATFHPDQACGMPTCLVPGGGRGTIQVSPPDDGGCAPLPMNLCGTGGSVSPTGQTYNAMCAPTVTPMRSTPGWNSSARVCSTACPDSGMRCVIGPTTGFVATACVFQSGDVPCPMTGYVNKSVFYTGFNDSRSCSTCSCNGVDGGTCVNIGQGTASSMTAYTASDCTGSSWTDLTLDVCSLYAMNTLIPNPASVSYLPTITHGDCSGVSMAPQPQGSVTPMGPTTVCCM
jgi:hypothetical protein